MTRATGENDSRDRDGAALPAAEAGGDHGAVGHIDIDRMLALAHGDVESAEADEIRAHARACRECGDELAVMLALRLAERGAERPEGGASPPRLGTRTAGSPGLGAPAWVRGLGSGRGGRAAIAASLVFVAVLAALLASDVFAPSPPAELVALATTAPPDRIDLAFLLGGDPLVAERAPDARDAFGMIVDGRTGEAVELLSNLNTAQPEDGTVATGLGIALYLTGREDGRAELLLIQGAGNPRQDLSHTAKWYLANLYLRQGDLVRAARMLEDISTGFGFPGSRARDLLQRLGTEGHGP